MKIKYLPPGWLADSEIERLYELGQDLPKVHPVIVEIGSWLGKSSVVLASAIQGTEKPHLYCIDPWNGAGGPEYKEVMARDRITDPFSEFLTNIVKAGVAEVVYPLRGLSQDIRRHWNSGMIDFLFIDGDHAEEAVREDLRMWVPLLKPGGHLAMHDFFPPEYPNTQGYIEGPFKAVEAELTENDWENARITNTLFTVTKK